MSDVTQPSLFSAETLPPEVADLGGLLAAHGQFASAPDGARLSIVLGGSWRADALRRECDVRGIDSEHDVAGVADAWGGDGQSILFRTGRTVGLGPTARAWTRGAVKFVPPALVATDGFFRVWLIAAGRGGDAGYHLGLDPHAPDTHTGLVAACARAGLAGVAVRVAGAPALRLTGRKRLRRLREMVGEPPPGAPAGSWPGDGSSPNPVILGG